MNENAVLRGAELAKVDRARGPEGHDAKHGRFGGRGWWWWCAGAGGHGGGAGHERGDDGELHGERW